jgi:MFS family permease
MVAADLIRAALLLPLLAIGRADQVWLVYVVALLQSAVSRFFIPAETALVPTIVDEQELATANAAMSTAEAVGRLGGPALGGALFAVRGGHAAAIADALSFGFSAVMLSLMPLPSFQPSPTNAAAGAVRGVLRDLAVGVRVVLDRPVLRAAVGGMGVFMLSEGVIEVLLVPLVSEVWRGSSTELGWLLSVQGVGALAGGVVLSAIGARFSPRLGAAGGGMCTGVLLAVMVNQSSILVALGIMAVAGLAVVSLIVGAETLVQLGSDAENRGRVAALLGTVMAITELVGMAITGAVADRFGPVPLVDAAAAVMVLGGCVLFLAPHV